MTKAELIQMLSSLPDDAIIVLPRDNDIDADPSRYFCNSINTIEEVTLFKNGLATETDDYGFECGEFCSEPYEEDKDQKPFTAYCIQSESL